MGGGIRSRLFSRWRRAWSAEARVRVRWVRRQIRNAVGCRLRCWSDRLIDPGERPDILELVVEMVRAAGAAGDRVAGIPAVIGVLRPVDESKLAPAAVFLATLLAHPAPGHPRGPADVPEWADGLLTNDQFLRMVDHLRAEGVGEVGTS